MSQTDANRIFGYALDDIRKLLDSTHADATPGEKLVRIGCVIGNLPAPLRDMIVNEAQTRVGIGWAAGIKPTQWKDSCE
jgi:hypothetical protein